MVFGAMLGAGFKGDSGGGIGGDLTAAVLA
jgi:hypothetical protein